MTESPKPFDGPWYVDGAHIRDANGYALASVPHTLGDDSDRANAQLMAAAPDLVDALRLLLGAVNSRYTPETIAYEGITDQAAAAIALAVGDKAEEPTP